MRWFTIVYALGIEATILLAAGESIKFSNSFISNGDLLISANNGTSITEVLPIGLGVFALKERQLSCNPGYHLCTNGGCCATGYNCQPTGCCLGSQVQCGSNNCYNPATDVCCSDGSHCPLGYDCVSGGCCPSGTLPCGDRKCYDPRTQRCCEGGGCPTEDSCCKEECCRSIAYCAADGFCSACPAATRTVTATTRPVITTTITTTAIKIVEPEEAPEFSCIPVTVTNSAGAVLELGDDCALEYTPPETTAGSGDAGSITTSATSATTPARRALPDALLFPRQTACTPYTTVTKTTTSTVPTTTRETKTVTRTTEAEGFSCLPMAVTNSAGDELALNEECQLEFTPAETTSSSSTTARPSSSATGGGSAAVSVRGTLGAFWQYSVVGIVGFLLVHGAQ